MSSPAFYFRPDYAQLARDVNAASASATTVFLFARLWARSARYKGLWWDDYLLVAAWAILMVGNGLGAASPLYGFSVLDGHHDGITMQFASVSIEFIAIALSKLAFGTTLLRLTQWWDKLALYVVMTLVTLFNVVMAVITWLDICDSGVAYPGSAMGMCIHMSVAKFVHVGATVVDVVADITLAAYPWLILRHVSVSKREKRGVAMAMSLVGISAGMGIGKTVILSWYPTAGHGKVNYTYGAVVAAAFHQGEAATMIMAQTVPVIRTLLSGGSSTRASIASGEKKPQGPGAQPAAPGVLSARLSTTSGIDGDDGLVQLSTGRVVTAEEARRLREAGEEPMPVGPVPPENAPGEEAAAPPGEAREVSNEARYNDEVHRVWADMGLSRRAWSKSPSPPSNARG